MKILICYGTRPEYIKIKNFFNYNTNINFEFLFVKQHQNLIFGDYQYSIDIINENPLNTNEDILVNMDNKFFNITDDEINIYHHNLIKNLSNFYLEIFQVNFQ